MSLDDEPWGYCKYCARDVAVNDDERLVSHKAYVGDCDGSGERPHRRPRWFSRRFMFKAHNGGTELDGLKRPFQTIYGRAQRRD